MSTLATLATLDADATSLFNHMFPWLLVQMYSKSLSNDTCSHIKPNHIFSMLSSTRLLLTRARSVLPRHTAAVTLRAFSDQSVGIVKWFNETKGFGFIQQEDGPDGQLMPLPIYCWCWMHACMPPPLSILRSLARVKMTSYPCIAVFVHYSSIKGEGFRTLVDGQKVSAISFLGMHVPKAGVEQDRVG